MQIQIQHSRNRSNHTYLHTAHTIIITATLTITQDNIAASRHKKAATGASSTQPHQDNITHRHHGAAYRISAFQQKQNSTSSSARITIHQQHTNKSISSTNEFINSIPTSPSTCPHYIKSYTHHHSISIPQSTSTAQHHSTTTQQHQSTYNQHIIVASTSHNTVKIKVKQRAHQNITHNIKQHIQ